MYIYIYINIHIYICICIYIYIDIDRYIEKRFEHIELPAKLLDYLLRSHKSNINQYMSIYIYICSIYVNIYIFIPTLLFQTFRVEMLHKPCPNWCNDNQGDCEEYVCMLIPSILKYISVSLNMPSRRSVHALLIFFHRTATHCNTLQHTVTHCNMPF